MHSFRLSLLSALLAFASVPSLGAETSEGAFVIIEDQWIDEGYFDPGAQASQFGARPDKVRLWPDGVLPIQFKKNVGPALRQMVLEACAEWSRAANVRCILGEYKGASLVIGRSFAGIEKGCWSMLGSDFYFLALRRRMNLGLGCDSYPTVLHELGHALGLTHEHQRPDRDDYVQVLAQNVADPFLGIGKKLNFAKQSAEAYTPYDFFSIMHYSRKATSKNGQDTLVPRPGFEHLIDVMGRATRLSDLDREAISAMYGPPPAG